jgi:hypothetical protein
MMWRSHTFALSMKELFSTNTTQPLSSAQDLIALSTSDLFLDRVFFYLHFEAQNEVQRALYAKKSTVAARSKNERIGRVYGQIIGFSRRYVDSYQTFQAWMRGNDNPLMTPTSSFKKKSLPITGFVSTQLAEVPSIAEIDAQVMKNFLKWAKKAPLLFTHPVALVLGDNYQSLSPTTEVSVTQQYQHYFEDLLERVTQIANRCNMPREQLLWPFGFCADQSLFVENDFVRVAPNQQQNVYTWRSSQKNLSTEEGYLIPEQHHGMVLDVLSRMIREERAHRNWLLFFDAMRRLNLTIDYDTFTYSLFRTGAPEEAELGLNINLENQKRFVDDWSFLYSIPRLARLKLVDLGGKTLKKTLVDRWSVLPEARLQSQSRDALLGQVSNVDFIIPQLEGDDDDGGAEFGADQQWNEYYGNLRLPFQSKKNMATSDEIDVGEERFELQNYWDDSSAVDALVIDLLVTAKKHLQASYRPHPMGGYGFLYNRHHLEFDVRLVNTSSSFVNADNRLNMETLWRARRHAHLATELFLTEFNESRVNQVYKPFLWAEWNRASSLQQPSRLELRARHAHKEVILIYKFDKVEIANIFRYGRQTDFSLDLAVWKNLFDKLDRVSTDEHFVKPSANALIYQKFASRYGDTEIDEKKQDETKRPFRPPGFIGQVTNLVKNVFQSAVSAPIIAYTIFDECYGSKHLVPVYGQYFDSKALQWSMIQLSAYTAQDQTLDAYLARFESSDQTPRPNPGILTARQLIHILTDVAGALVYLETRNLVHSNISATSIQVDKFARGLLSGWQNLQCAGSVAVDGEGLVSLDDNWIQFVNLLKTVIDRQLKYGEEVNEEGWAIITPNNLTGFKDDVRDLADSYGPIDNLRVYNYLLYEPLQLLIEASEKEGGLGTRPMIQIYARLVAIRLALTSPPPDM